jgi:lipopolysaccharide export system permease protein
LLKPLFVLLIPVALLLLTLSFWVAPRAAEVSESLLKEALKSATLWGLQPGRFQVMQKGKLVVYVESVGADGRALNNIFLRHLEDNRSQVWVAATGEYWLDQASGNRFLTLINGQVTESAINGRDVRTLSFERNDLMLPEPAERQRSIGLETLPLRALLRDGSPQASAELQWRISPTLAVLVLGLLAIPLSHADPREGRGARAALGLLVYAVYANSLYMSRNWVANDVLPPALGLWWIHCLVALVALFWLYRQGRMVGRA